MATDIIIFSQPQGDMRGIATEIVEIKGKSKRIAHGYVDSKKDLINLDVPKKISPADARMVIAKLLVFLDAYEKA